jgi:type I restriction enzyme S subunit
MDAVGDDGTIRLDQTREVGDVETGYTYFADGDVTYAKITPCFENGKGAVMRGLKGGIGFGTTELTVARPTAGNSAEFLHWLFTSPPFRKLGEGSMYGAGGQKRVPDDFARDFRLALPSVAEQSAIAAFLDRETGKIDALVEAQRRLIELLKEKRQAVISQAVTKGLDPTAPMKDSGLEWLGEVPAHWSVVPTRSLLARRRQLVGERHPDFHLLSLTLGGIVIRDRDSGHGKFPAEFDTYQVVKPLDLVFCLFDMDETPRTVGLSEHVGMVTGAYDVFSGKIDEVSDFLFWLYLSRDFKKSLKPFYTGLRKVIRRETFGSIPVALPPLSERRAIIDYLQVVTQKLDALSAQAVGAISLLQERRSALISAAVIGKIDVRGLVPDQAEAA